MASPLVAAAGERRQAPDGAVWGGPRRLRLHVRCVGRGASSLALGARFACCRRSPGRSPLPVPCALHFLPPCCCACLCRPPPPDDDNDLALAALVRKAYLPGITADSVAAAVAAAPERFYVAAAKGVFGAEEVLRVLVGEQMAAAGGGEQ